MNSALAIHGKEPSNVFQLTGSDENSATFALGWVLERSPAYRKLVMGAVFGDSLDVSNAAIALQRHAEDGGYTDLEVQSGRQFHVIFEAKRWWSVPTVKQFERYLPRLDAGRAERRRLISVSAADATYARRQLPDQIDGIGLIHLSWGDLERLAEKARYQAGSFEEKLWLRQWIRHLQEFISMERQNNNNVYVVALGTQAMIEGQKHTWIDVVEKDKCYFHPVGHTWPVQPPNYIGFRYRGKLQSVHHIDSFDVAENISTVNPLWPETEIDHFIYQLGPPMRPSKEVKSGTIWHRRVWCAIDTLLSGAFDTISDAINETKRRWGDTV